MRILISEESSFEKVRYSINSLNFELNCFSVDGELKDFFPYPKMNPIQSVFYTYYNKDFRNVIVSTPTSSGKSGIIYLAVYKHFDKYFKGFIYSSPTKALIEEKYKEFKLFYGPRNLRVDIKTGDYISKKIDPSTDIICTTYDSLVIAMRGQNEWVDKSFIVIDEVHTLVSSMGKYLIEILALAKNYQIPLILLSGTLPILEDLENYLNPELVLISKYRPVKLNTYSLFLSKEYLKDFYTDLGLSVKKISEKSILYVLEACVNRAKSGEKIIIFVWSKSLGWQFLKFASLLGLKIKNETINFDLENLPKFDMGIAFHNADIPFDERQKIEQEFRDDSSDLRILIATQTLAMGVNLPADTTFINIKTYYTTEGWKILPSVLDILQEEGRVGRFGLRQEGHSFRVFWNPPNTMKKKLLNLENMLKDYTEYFEESTFHNILSILILSSINLFGDERLVFSSIIKTYFEQDELKKIVSTYIGLLQEWGFINNNKLTVKSSISIHTNIPPHFLQGFFEMMKFIKKIVVHYLDFAYLLAIRCLLHTKNFTSYTDMYEFYDWKGIIQEGLKIGKKKLEDIQELIEILISDYLGFFVRDKKKYIERLWIGCWEYLCWCSGIIMQKYPKPIGEYSTIKTDVNHLIWSLYRCLPKKDIDPELIKRYELSLIYGSNPNYSILGKIKDIGHKRIAILSQKLQEIGIEYLHHEEEIFQYEEVLNKDRDIKSILGIIKKNLLTRELF